MFPDAVMWRSCRGLKPAVSIGINLFARAFRWLRAANKPTTNMAAIATYGVLVIVDFRYWRPKSVVSEVWCGGIGMVLE